MHQLNHSASNTPRRRRGVFAVPASWMLLASIMLAFLLGPLLALLVRIPMTAPSEYTKPYVLEALRVSLITASAAVWVDALLCIPLGFWLARSRSKIRHLVTAMVLLPLALPPVIAGYVLELFLVVKRDAPDSLGRFSLALNVPIVGTLQGSILAQMYVAAPFIVMSTRAAVSGVDQAYEDAARSLGCSKGRAMEKVILPMARRGILLGLVLGWIRCMGEFGAVSVLAYYPHTMPSLIYDLLAGSSLEATMAPAILLATVGSLAAGVVLWLSLDREPRTRARRHGRPTSTADVEVFSDVGRTCPPTDVLDVDIALAAGAFDLKVAFTAPPGVTALLGPSGAGKSLTLRSIAGFLHPHAGRIALGERSLLDVPAGVDLPPEDRHLGYVAQKDALFDHLSVAANVEFGIWRSSRMQRATVVSRLTRSLGVERHCDVSPRSLSGGERQRVALARALAPSPSMLLLDEAFSALDSSLRQQARRLVRSLHRETGIPVVLVTHDREDVLELAGYVVVIVGGRVLQAGPIEEVFARPAAAEVAQLVGVTNLLPVLDFGTLDGGDAVVRTPWANAVVAAAPGAGPDWLLAVPSDAVQIVAGSGPATIEACRPATGGWTVDLRRPGVDGVLEALVARTGNRLPPTVGTACSVRLEDERCCLVTPPSWAGPEMQAADVLTVPPSTQRHGLDG